MAEDEPERSDEATTGRRSGDLPRGPDPELTPEQVVRAQTRTIQRGGESGAAPDAEDGDAPDGKDGAAPGVDGGESVTDADEQVGLADRDDAPGEVLRTIFAFAAPEFRRRHGDFEGMAAALTNPINRPLVAAETVERGPIDVDDGRAVQKVLARAADGEVRTYEIVLERQAAGEHEGCWMTVAIDMVYVGESPAFRRRPSVAFDGQTIACDEGATLRDVLLRAEGRSPYNDVSQVANCGGNGLCGTCAVEVCGDVDDPSERERRRLELPPHSGEDDLRLSCRTAVLGDLTVVKHDGVFGQRVDEQRRATAGDEADRR